MTIYDGASNLNTDYVSPVATSNTTPSPIVCSFSVSTSTNMEAYRAFDQNTANSSGTSAASTLPLSWMIKLGSEKLINKYLITANATSSNANPKSWVLQGTNNAAATAADAKNANDWTDLDTRTDILSFTPYFTFSNGTAYSAYRLYVTKNRAGETAACTYCLIGEIRLVEQLTPVVCDVVENIETTDTVVANIIFTVDVSEILSGSVTVLVSKSYELIDISESAVSIVNAEIFQSLYTLFCAENSLSTDSYIVNEVIHTNVIEYLGSGDSTSASDTFIVHIDEATVGNEIVTSIFLNVVSIESSLVIGDISTSESFLAVFDIISIIDQTVNELLLSLLDSLSIKDLVSINWNGHILLIDTFSIYEDIKLQFIQTINEALALTDSPSVMLELLLSEFITFTETTLPNWNTTRTVNESLALTDILYQQLNLILTEALTCTDSAPLCQLGLVIYEYLGFTELLSSPGRFSVGATDTLDAVDSLAFGYTQVISDVFSLADTADTIRLLLNTVAEGMGLSESIAASLKSVFPIAESLTLVDIVASQGQFYHIIHDTLTLTIIVELDGEVWECYVLNTPKFLPSIYSGFNFNSYCVFQNRAYGCKADGIYELTGDTDNGTVINTGVQLSETKFGLSNQKRFRKAYIGVSGTTPLLSMETETGETKTYSIDTDGEVDASRSLRSKKWKLTVTNFESLDFIKLVPVVLAK